MSEHITQDTGPLSSRAEPQELPGTWAAASVLSDVVHRVGHDIGNPLTAIISLASIIEFSTSQGSDFPKDKLQEYAASMTAEAWKVSHVVERFVMIFSQRVGNRIPCSIGETAEKAILRLRSRLHLDDLSVESDFFFAPTAARVLADVDQLFLLISELLLNAYHFQGPPSDPELGRTVQCTLEAEGSFVKMRFTNSMPLPYQDNLSDLFLPNRTGHPIACTEKSRIPKAVRTGLGLSCAWAIVHRHGGKIFLQQSKSDNGWQFAVEVLLPMAEEERH